MKNNCRKKLQKTICLLLTTILLVNSIPMSGVMAQTNAMESNGWDGVTREKTWQEELCRITYTLADCWADGYTAIVTMENISDTTIENWHVSFSIAQQLTNLWNAQIVESTNSNIVFKNMVWNQDIAAGQTVSFGFTGAGAFAGFPEICDLPASLQVVPNEDYEIVYEVTNAWDTGFNGSLCILNKSGRTIEDWQVSLDLPHKIDDLWGGQIVSCEDNHYVIKNSVYNQNIAAGKTVRMGFTVNSGNAGNRPENMLLQEITLTEGNSGQDNGTNAGEDVSSGDVKKELALTIDTSAFDINEAGGFYLTKERVETLSGIISNVDMVEKLSYTITDINELVVHNGDITPQENWEAQGIGLVVGFNLITVTATRGQKETKESIVLVNFNEENMDRANVDRSDTDGDGIDNYIESVLGTNPLLADTDGDGLDDLAELTKTATDPTNADTNGNGVLDGDEDYDEDGLCNLAEVQEGTNPLLADTDYDGLTDGEEVTKYLTSPLTVDTDDDGLKDGADVRLGFDPLNPDTNGNGVPDRDETVRQTFVKELAQDKTAGVTEVSVTMDCSGDIEDEVQIMDIYNLDMRTTDVAGLVGAPVSIETEAAFDEATLTFTYDKAALGETKEDNLRIMWYNEEDDLYVLLDEETTLDKENHTLSCETDHFSTWMVVDRTIWLDAMRQDVNYRTGGDVLCYDMALAVDVSLSMQENNRFPLAKSALNSLVDGMLEGDRAGLIRYNDTATVVRQMTGDKDSLKAGINSLSLRYGNNADNGIRAGLDMLDKADGNNRRTIVLVCDGDVRYNASLVKQAREKDITIHCVNVVDGSASAMQRIAEDTGGGYYYAATSADIMKAMAGLKEDTLGEVDTTDSDGDGLYDVYETRGMRLSNGQTVYTDPHNPDTDGDGITDFEEVGGLPEQVTYRVDGKEYTSVLFLGSVNDRLSSEFMYVDGRVNADGTVNNERMGYVPYSDEYIKDKYEQSTRVELFDETRYAEGAARVHGIFADKLVTLPESKLRGYWGWNSLIVLGITLGTFNADALNCFYAYSLGTGGDLDGWVEGYTRKKMDVTTWIMDMAMGTNSMKENYMLNTQKAKAAAESVLNEHRTEVWLSVSPTHKWNGCHYVDYAGDMDIAWAGDAALNVLFSPVALGTFNDADAGITMHCTYDAEKKEYFMEYFYYIIDYYDFSNLQFLYEQDALGLAKSYELYGYTHGYTWWK